MSLRGPFELPRFAIAVDDLRHALLLLPHGEDPTLQSCFRRLAQENGAGSIMPT